MDKIDTLMTRGVEKIYPSKEALEKVLRTGKKLKIYQGFDPTGIELHIGHMVGLRKLRQFQDAGHEVIFLIGDGTGQAGDPSGKTRTRERFLSQQELRKNAKDYVKQAGKVVRFEEKNAVKIKYNGDWLNKLSIPQFLEIADHFTASQFLERDLYQDRIKRKEPISLREFFYPLLQAYDCVVMDVDLEVGGSDQTFNMLAGRQLMKAMKRKEKFVLTTPLLTDSRGIKIGKTEGNVIALQSKPNDLYAMILNLSDDVITRGLEYLTDVSIEEIKKITEKIKLGDNPMPFKKLLAFEIVKSLNSEKDAKEAQTFFEQAHQKGEMENLSNIAIVSGANQPLREIVEKHLSLSGTAVKQLVRQKAIDANGVVVDDPNFPLKSGDTIQVGKKHIFKIK